MSYWVYLEAKDEYSGVQVPEFIAGGIVKALPSMNGLRTIPDTEAEVNVTYNYSRFFYEYLSADGLRYLDGKKAQDTIAVLEIACSNLPDEPDTNYWASTPGNAGHILHLLLGWAKLYPEAIWRVS
jgi:hypothetical protein